MDIEVKQNILYSVYALFHLFQKRSLLYAEVTTKK